MTTPGPGSPLNQEFHTYCRAQAALQPINLVQGRCGSRAALTMPAEPRTVCPQLRTRRCSAGIGEECHFRTHAMQQNCEPQIVQPLASATHLHSRPSSTPTPSSISPKPLRSQRRFDSIRILSESGPAPNRHCFATHIDVPGFLSWRIRVMRSNPAPFPGAAT